MASGFPFTCKLQLLGGMAAELASGVSVTPSRRKAQALLAYLALHASQAQPRDKLAALLWSEAPAPRARHSLRQALLEVRRALPPGGMVETGEAVAIAPDAMDVDVAAFERLLADGSPAALDQAAMLYRGDLLAGLGTQDAPFEAWLLGERERLRELALDGLARLLAHQTGIDAREAAIRTAIRLLGIDPAAEAVHRTLMRLYARSGRRGAALRQYQACVDALQHELDAAPEPETRELYQTLLRADVDAAGPRATAPDAGVGGQSVHDLPLVGREAERARLLEAWTAAAAGRGQIVVIEGEAGIGKSRLVGEVVVATLERGGRVLAGRAYEAEQILPFGPWIDAIRQSGALADVEGRLAPGVRSELGRLFPELAPPVPAQGAEHVVRLFEAVTQLLAALANPWLTLLVLEDLHWADDLSARLLAFLARRVESWPLLLVVTARQEALAEAPRLRQVLGDLEQERRAVRLTLVPLARPHAEALVRSLARVGTDAVALARLVEQAWAASEGNPFVLVETMRALADGTLVPAAAGLTLPERVRRTIGQRLRSLPEPARHVADVAAVIGREVDFTLLQRAARLEPDASAEAVEALVARHVLHVVGERLEFTHDRIREVAYAELLPPTRRMLHATVGRVLEEAFTGRHGEVADQLAGHFSRSEEADRAVRYLALAAERAAAAYAHADAAATLEEAWRSVPRLPGPDQPRWLVDLAVRRALALTFLGRFPEARELLWPLREHVRRLGDTVLAAAYWFRLAMTASYLGDQTEAAHSGQAALDAAGACGDEVLRGRAHYVLGVASHYRGRPHGAVEHSGHAIACLDRTADHPWRGLARLTLALGHLALGAFDAALDALAEMEAIGQAIGEPRLRSFAAAYSGAVLATRGDTAAGVEACRRGLTHAADPVTAALAESRVGQAWLEHGDASQAIPVLTRALEAMDRFRYRAVEVMCALVLAEAHLLAGDTAAARSLAGRGLAIAREDDYRFWVPYGERVLGRLAWAEGALGEADARLREAVAGFAAIPAPFEEGRTHLALAELAHARGDLAGGDVHLGSARARFEALRAPVYLERAAALAATARPGPGRP